MSRQNIIHGTAGNQSGIIIYKGIEANWETEVDGCKCRVLPPI